MPSAFFRFAIPRALLLSGAFVLGVCVTARAADLPFATGPSPAASAPVAKPLGRPRIGLVLSGGGARGLAHVGVLKVLERERVPVDVIAGTSMGAIIGGLYASGMRAEELEHELLKVQWSSLFASRVERQELSQRRKEEDFEVSPLLELGLRGGELRTPLSAVSSRGLESLLRRYTLRVRSVRRFDELPIPFRAVATDMENGQALVLAEGDLALALRSSMSVPGVFSPTDVNGRILGDGGIVNNVPVDVARTMGADIVIVVNIGTPLAGRDTLGSVLGVTAQTIGILIGQNVERSLASLHADDVLVTPALGTLTSGDFDRTREFIDLGEAGALAALQRLTALAVSPEVYAASVGTRPPVRRPTLDFIGFQGSGDTSPELFASQLESRAGEPFDPDKAERDARALAATGDYLRADYQLVNTAEGDGLVFDLTDKPWGPNYFHVGLDMSTDFTGNSAFNIKIAHNRHWLTRNGTEWRNRLQIGSVPMFSTEIYHPLGLASSLANDWFVAAYAGIERRSLSVYDPDQDVDVELARFRRTTTRVGVDIGQPWGRFGELRAGLTFREADTEPVTVTAKFLGSIQPTRFQEAGLRVRTVIDQLDYAIFPLGGYRMEAEAGYARVSDHERVKRVELQGTYVVSAGAHTLNLNGQARAASGWSGNVLGRYTLGGFQNLSGYLPSQLSGDFLLFTRATWYMRLSKAPTLTRGFFVGASIEAGNAWLTRQEAKLSNLRSGMSVFLGADTGIGPLYLGITHAPQGSTGLTLFIGRP